MVVTLSHKGYIKRVPLTTYRAQHRGGKGVAGRRTNDDDFIEHFFVASTHTPVLFFSSSGGSTSSRSTACRWATRRRAAGR